ncbi:protein N-lysine methyltransferase METTL21D-like [Littorina saxatilis]|uniref:Protein-lysine methyltransferase METTL21D n=1 Tax=Littorina saxatilis TaxID=31220 RepID=A0AAN9AS73_9CAEN
MAASMDLSKLFVREYEKNDGTVLKFYQSEIGDVGCVVWDAALVLSKYLETGDLCKRSGGTMQGKTVVELGAGTGAVGLVAASMGADVTVTDLAEFVPLMEHNIKENATSLTGKMHATTLTWGASISDGVPSAPDLVLLADCIYYEESLEPLVKTIHSLCCPTTRVLCCYEKRDTGNKPELERKFFELVEAVLNKQEIPHQRQDPHFSSDDIYIFEFRLKDITT